MRESEKLYKLQKLDRRHTGREQFSHYITPKNKLAFLELRNWCWTQFGPGMERDWAIELGNGQYSVSRWAWDTEFKHMRIYFTGDAELTAFLLWWA
jgi:hypothetical protein